jgi:rhodanese-related sulfurtransferase
MMIMETSAPLKLLVGPVEYFRAKLEYEIAPDALKKLLEKSPHNISIVDVRDAGLYAAGHIPGARNIPVDSLVTAFSSLDKDRTIVTYSGDLACGLSTQAALELAQKGFRVQRLIGGLLEWSRKGFTLEETASDHERSQAW